MSLTPEDMILQADRMNVRLELMRGMPVWEASPVAEHQLEVDRIRASLRAPEDESCACFHLADVLFRFADDSLKRPDIAILCERPDSSLLRNALPIVPEAVIEIISVGYERKDLELAPSFYLSFGVKDVVVLDPQTKLIYHYRKDGVKRLESLAEIELECGCYARV